MSYSCQFCGDIEENEVLLRCGACNAEQVVRGVLGSRCGACADTSGNVTPVCPTCGSEELEQ